MILGEDIHFIPPRYDADPASRARPGFALERAAKITGNICPDGTVDLVSFNRTGLFFGCDIAHDPTARTEWTWHHTHECATEETLNG